MRFTNLVRNWRPSFALNARWPRSRPRWLLGCLALCLAGPFLSRAQAQTALSNGGSQDGTLAPGAIDLYTLTAAAGDRVVLQIAKLSGGAAFTPVLQVVGPDGSGLGTASDAVAARLDIQAPAAGTYTVKVSDSTLTGSGNYRLRLAQVPGSFVVPAGDDGGPLTNGVGHLGTIETGDLDLWTVSANAGDRLTLQVAEMSGGANFAPQIELFGPDGTRLALASNPLVARLDCQAPTGGTYTALVSDRDRRGSGSYQLQLVHMPGASVVPAGDEGGTIQANTDTDGVIVLGDLDLWSFDAAVGDHIIVQLTELSGGANFTPQIELLAPNGERKAAAAGPSGGTIDVAIESAGTYGLLVSDATQIGTGSYRLHLTRGTIGPPELNTLINGSSSSGTIAAAGQTNRWSFTASAGENIIVRIGETTTGAFVPWLRLYSPAGVLLQQSFNQAAAEVTTRATNSGTFLVVVSDGSAGRNQTGSYRINMAKTGSPVVISPNDEGGPMVNGITYAGSIETGDLDAWTFSANAGETIVVRAGETTGTSGLVPWLRLFGPDGTQVSESFNAAAAEVVTRATNSGTFLVVIADGSAGRNQTGNYRISLAKTGSPVAISQNDEGGAMVNGTTYLGSIDIGDIDAWTFNANSGENIVVRMGETTAGSALLPWLRLYGPDGTLLSDDYNAGTAEVTTRATNSGTFMVVAADGSAGRNQTGNYRISLAKTGSPLVISQNDEGGPMVNGTTYLGSIDIGDIDAWTFNANSGDDIVVRMGETTAGSALLPWLRLYGPDGTLLSNDYNAAAAEVTTRATNSGTFMVVAADGSAGRNQTGNYRISLAKTGTPVVISPNDEGGPMVGASVYPGAIETGDLDVWTFTACAGDTISLSVVETVSGSTLTPWLRLYGKDGVLLKNVFGAAKAEFSNYRAPNSGTYEVVVSDGSAGLGGSGNYTLTVNGLSDGLKLCTPVISQTDVVITGIGGAAQGPFILLSSTNAAIPLKLWSPITTNYFDSFGVMNFTNLYDAREAYRFFTLQIP